MTSDNMNEGKTGGPTPGNTFRYTLRLWESGKFSRGGADDQVEDLDTDDPAVLGAVLRAVANRVDPHVPGTLPPASGQPGVRPIRPPLTYDDGQGDGWINGVTWAAGEVVAQLEAHGVDWAIAVDLRDHLEACADHPDRPTATPRGPLAPVVSRTLTAEAMLDELREAHTGAVKLAEAMRRQRDDAREQGMDYAREVDRLRVQLDERAAEPDLLLRKIQILEKRLNHAQEGRDAALAELDRADRTLRAVVDEAQRRVDTPGRGMAMMPAAQVLDIVRVHYPEDTPGGPLSATEAPQSGQPEGEGYPEPENGAQRAVFTQREAPSAERET